MGTLSVRLDAETVSALDRVIARTGKSKSEVVREALADYKEKLEKAFKNERPYDKIKHLIGILDSGGMHFRNVAKGKR
jgi:predicted DNA-binding protein